VRRVAPPAGQLADRNDALDLVDAEGHGALGRHVGARRGGRGTQAPPCHQLQPQNPQPEPEDVGAHDEKHGDDQAGDDEQTRDHGDLRESERARPALWHAQA
jgi:hypothetical protein